MEDKKIKVQGKEYSENEFNQLKENIEKEKNKKLKQISENEYSIVEKMYG